MNNSRILNLKTSSLSLKANKDTKDKSMFQKPSNFLFGDMQQSQPKPQSSLFGNNTQKPSLFNNQPQQQQTSLLFGNNQQPQQQQQQQLQQLDSRMPVIQPSRFSKYQLKEQDNALFSSESKVSCQRSIKKRTIPSHLIKRNNKIQEDLNVEEKISIPTLPFKNTRQTEPDDSYSDDFAGFFKGDRPPTRSLFDSTTYHEENPVGELVIDDLQFSKMNSNPDEFANVFQKPARTIVQEEKNESGVPWNSRSKNDRNNSKKNKIDTKTELERLYCSVIVYGFEDVSFGLIIEHFSKYGYILEDFGSLHSPISGIGNGRGGFFVDLNDSTNNGGSNNKENNSKALKSSNYPIFIGPGWVKITYNNPNSAIRALVQNNTLDDRKNCIGVIPYRRGDLEILLGEKIPDNLNVGEGLHGLSRELELEKDLVDNPIGRLLKDARGDSLDQETGEKRKGSGLRIRDGTELILNKKNEKKDEKGIVSRGMGFLFGSGEV